MRNCVQPFYSQAMLRSEVQAGWPSKPSLKERTDEVEGRTAALPSVPALATPPAPEEGGISVTGQEAKCSPFVSRGLLVLVWDVLERDPPDLLEGADVFAAVLSLLTFLLLKDKVFTCF